VADPTARILIVEDDEALRGLLELTMQTAGYETLALADGTALEERVAAFGPDLAVLDVWLPGVDGLKLARRLRATPSSPPVLFLTAAATLEERLEGFAAGGSDYMAKPFSTEELLARVRALLQLAGREQSGVWTVGDVVIDESSRTVVAAGPPLDLTRTEFDLLVALVRNCGHVRTKRQLLEQVWGYDAYDTHLVEVHISALRRKLSAHGKGLIETVRGVGYVVRPA
jgi:DNA-binding response OmpR family regulator